MKPEEQIKALAELDGLEWMRDPHDNCWCWFNKLTKWFCGKNLFSSDDSIDWEALPDYLHSYDAIIPLIQKQGSETLFKMYSFLRQNAFKLAGNPPELPILTTAYSEPAQLCEALLRAAGKWKE